MARRVQRTPMSPATPARGTQQEEPTLALLMQYMKEFNAKMDANTQELKASVQQLDANTQELKASVQQLDAKVEHLDAKVEHLDAKVEHLDAKVDDVLRHTQVNTFCNVLPVLQPKLGPNFFTTAAFCCSLQQLHEQVILPRRLLAERPNFTELVVLDEALRGGVGTIANFVSQNFSALAVFALAAVYRDLKRRDQALRQRLGFFKPRNHHLRFDLAFPQHLTLGDMMDFNKYANGNPLHVVAEQLRERAKGRVAEQLDLLQWCIRQPTNDCATDRIGLYLFASYNGILDTSELEIDLVGLRRIRGSKFCVDIGELKTSFKFHQPGTDLTKGEQSSIAASAATAVKQLQLRLDLIRAFWVHGAVPMELVCRQTVVLVTNADQDAVVYENDGVFTRRFVVAAIPKGSATPSPLFAYDQLEEEYDNVLMPTPPLLLPPPPPTTTTTTTTTTAAATTTTTATTTTGPWPASAAPPRSSSPPPSSCGVATSPTSSAGVGDVGSESSPPAAALPPAQLPAQKPPQLSYAAVVAATLPAH